MAKKAVATFDAKAGAKHMVKVIRMEKSPKTGAYVFVEQLVEQGTRSNPASTHTEIKWFTGRWTTFFRFLGKPGMTGIPYKMIIFVGYKK